MKKGIRPGQLWDLFHEKKGMLPGLVPGGQELGASFMGQASNGTFLYFAEALAQPGAGVPKGFATWELPAGEYVVCAFKAETLATLKTSALDKAFAYLFETWLPRKRLATQPFSAEKYTGVTGDAASMEIWVQPVPVQAMEGSQ